jgi:hypothetical protein
VNYEIIELEPFSGGICKVYSIIPEGADCSLYDTFFEEYGESNEEEVQNINETLNNICHFTGARASYFKENEGKLGDGVCALFDEPERNLRVYCVRYGSVAIILGGGGIKGKDIKAYQEDLKLNKEAKLIIKYAEDINKRLSSIKDIYWSKDKTAIEGNLKNYDDEDE